MQDPMGVFLICGGVLVGVLAAAVLRTRLPKLVVGAALVVAGVAVGAGALLVQAEASGVEWVLTLAFLGLMAPFQARLVFGPLGRTVGPASGTVGPS